MTATNSISPERFVDFFFIDPTDSLKDEGIKKVLAAFGAPQDPQTIHDFKVGFKASIKSFFIESFKARCPNPLTRESLRAIPTKMPAMPPQLANMTKMLGIDHRIQEMFANLSVMRDSCVQCKITFFDAAKGSDKTLKKCISCKKAFYCSETCLTANLSAHKVTCLAKTAGTNLKPAGGEKGDGKSNDAGDGKSSEST